MIYISFIYKNSCVCQDSIALQFNDVNKAVVYRDIIAGRISRPANYDRMILTEEKLKHTLWVK